MIREKDSDHERVGAQKENPAGCSLNDLEGRISIVSHKMYTDVYSKMYSNIFDAGRNVYVYICKSVLAADWGYIIFHLETPGICVDLFFVFVRHLHLRRFAAQQPSSAHSLGSSDYLAGVASHFQTELPQTCHIPTSPPTQIGLGMFWGRFRVGPNMWAIFGKHQDRGSPSHKSWEVQSFNWNSFRSLLKTMIVKSIGAYSDVPSPHLFEMQCV